MDGIWLTDVYSLKRGQKMRSGACTSLQLRYSTEEYNDLVSHSTHRRGA